MVSLIIVLIQIQISVERQCIKAIFASLFDLLTMTFEYLKTINIWRNTKIIWEMPAAIAKELEHVSEILYIIFLLLSKALFQTY